MSIANQYNNLHLGREVGEERIHVNHEALIFHSEKSMSYSAGS